MTLPNKSGLLKKDEKDYKEIVEEVESLTLKDILDGFHRKDAAMMGKVITYLIYSAKVKKEKK